MSNSMRKIMKVTQNLVEWLANGGERHLERDYTALVEAEQYRGVHGLQRATFALGSFSTVYGTRGVVSLANGDNAWQDIDRSVLYCLWRIRIKAHLWRKVGRATNLSFEFPEIAGLVSYGIVCDSEVNTECVHYLTEDFFGQGWEGFWPQRRYEPFVLWLDKMSRGLSTDGEIVRNPPFDAIVDGWSLGEAEFADRLITVCDYHCENMEDKDETRSEFWRVPFNLIPWEVLAICKVRYQQGLPVPKIDHPILSLVTSFFPSCARSRTVTTDETIEKVEALFCECV